MVNSQTRTLRWVQFVRILLPLCPPAYADIHLQWTCASNRGFQTETQIWYSLLADGSFTITQVIWSYTG
jgi:hypothetical protein